MEMHHKQSSPGERENPQAVAALERGIQYLEDENRDQAIECFTEALRLFPRFTDAYLARACAYNEKGDFDLAINDCNEAIRLNSECTKAYRLRGKVHSKAGKWANAERDVAKARQIEARQQ